MTLMNESPNTGADHFFGTQYMADVDELVRIYFESVPRLTGRKQVEISVIEGPEFDEALDGPIRIPQQDRIATKHSRCVSVRSILEGHVFVVVRQVVNNSLPRHREILSALHPDSAGLDGNWTVT